MSEPDWANPGIGFEFVRANGLRFHVATCGAGDRLALCLHGFPETHYSWRHQLPLLASLGYRVWAPNLRGYGESDRPPRVADYAIELLLEDVAGMIDASGAREVVLLGHDWGGVIAWDFAMRNPERLSRLVVLNAPHPGRMDEERSWRQVARFWYAIFFQLPWLPEKLLAANGARAIGRAFERTSVHRERFGPDVQRVFAANAARPGALTAMLNYYRAFGRGGGARRQRATGYPRIETPTLLLWGVHDVALRLDVALRTERYVEDLTFRTLPEASHWVQQDDPETVNAMLSAWLTDEPVPEAGVRV